jgi:SAM-dependent methyltransferase
MMKSLDPRFWLRVWRNGEFDRANGTDTRFSRKIEERATLGSVNSDNRGHTTIKNTDLLVAALKSCPLPIDECTFVDIGCGKGRPLLEALRLPFRAVWGLELSQELSDIAQRNIEIFKSRHRIDIPAAAECGDILNARLPSGKLVVFLNNPFGAATMEVLAQRLAARVEPLVVLYFKPEHAQVLDQYLPASEWPGTMLAKGWIRTEDTKS